MYNQTNLWLSRLIWLPPTTFALLMGLWRGGNPSLWRDELATWSAATRSFPELLDLLRNADAVFAAYYIFMHYWVALFGTSELSLRLPSIVSTAASAGLLAVLGSRLYTPRVGLLAGTIFALVPGITRLAQEARSYGFVFLLAIGATYLLVLALERPNWIRWLGYAVTVALLGYAHLVALLLLIAHAAFVIFSMTSRQTEPTKRRTQKTDVAAWGIAAFLGVSATTPILWLGLRQREQISWVLPTDWTTPAALPEAIFGVGALAGILIGFALISVARAGRDERFVLLSAWAITPPLALLAISLFVSMWHPRYLLFIVPAVVLLASYTLAKLPWPAIAVSFALLLCLALPTQIELRRPGAHGADGKEIASIIRTNAQAGDGIAYSNADYFWESQATRTLVEYYIPTNEQPTDVFVSRSEIQEGHFRPRECADLRACLGETPRLWVVRLGNYHDPLEDMDESKATLLQDRYSQSRIWHVRDMTVALLS